MQSFFTGSHLGLKSFRGGYLIVVSGPRGRRQKSVVVAVVVDNKRKLCLSIKSGWIHRLLRLQTFDLFSPLEFLKKCYVF